MAMTAGQFFLYLLIIIILRESLASAASPTSDSVAQQTSESEAPSSFIRVSAIPTVNTRARLGFYQLHGFRTTKDFLKLGVYIEGADKPDSHSKIGEPTHMHLFLNST